MTALSEKAKEELYKLYFDIHLFKRPPLRRE
jgi:hypothetical protein